MQQSQKTLEFLQKLRDTGNWNDDYDYSEVEYVDDYTKIRLKYKVLGTTHLAMPNNPKCVAKNCTDKTLFYVAKSIITHKDKYDYSKTEYKSKVKSIIICPIHGEFYQPIAVHSKGKGCSRCSGNVRYTKAEAVERIKEIHGNVFDFSEFRYEGSTKNSKLICLIHGEFETSLTVLLRGTGCNDCSGNIRKYDNEKIIEKFNKKFNYKYDYSKLNYKTTHSKIVIICPIHGEFNTLSSAKHLSGRGCPSCTGREGSKGKSRTTKT